MVTARLWKENLDNVAQLFIEQFEEPEYEFNHQMSLLSYDQLAGMSVGQSVEVAMVNPNASNGYVLGYNNGVLGATGTANLQALKVTIDENATDAYKMIISKVAETRTERQEVTEEVARTFTVANGGSVTLTKQTSSIEGYDLYRATLSRNGSRQVNISFDGSLPQTVYLKAYRNNSTSSSYTVSLTGGTGTVTASTNNTLTSLTNFTAVSQTAATMNVTCQISNTQGTYYLYILIPNNITESVTETKDVEIPTGEVRYTIKSKLGNYGPTGDNTASWSTTLMQYDIANATEITDSQDITANINTVNNPTMIRFINPDGNFLNAGGSANGLKYSNGTGAWSVWNLWLLDEAMPG